MRTYVRTSCPSRPSVRPPFFRANRTSNEKTSVGRRFAPHRGRPESGKAGSSFAAFGRFREAEEHRRRRLRPCCAQMSHSTTRHSSQLRLAAENYGGRLAPSRYNSTRFFNAKITANFAHAKKERRKKEKRKKEKLQKIPCPTGHLPNLLLISICSTILQ